MVGEHWLGKKMGGAKLGFYFKTTSDGKKSFDVKPHKIS